MRIVRWSGSKIGWALILWFVVEVVLFWLATGTFGVLPTLAALALKGILGGMLLLAHLRSVLSGLPKAVLTRGLGGLGSTGFAALGALLIFLPGMLTTVAGLALFSPSVRNWVMNRFRRKQHASGAEGTITLEPNEWREVSSRSRRRAPAVQSGKVLP
ncbi:MAG TPA: FxsA family protein [Beijerinckiaceae bacterium]|nr:FxsA family protein [Beijerinckiaceae bacterium]